MRWLQGHGIWKKLVNVTASCPWFSVVAMMVFHEELRRTFHLASATIFIVRDAMKPAHIPASHLISLTCTTFRFLHWQAMGTLSLHQESSTVKVDSSLIINWNGKSKRSASSCAIHDTIINWKIGQQRYHETCTSLAFHFPHLNNIRYIRQVGISYVCNQGSSTVKVD